MPESPNSKHSTFVGVLHLIDQGIGSEMDQAGLKWESGRFVGSVSTTALGGRVQYDYLHEGGETPLMIIIVKQGVMTDNFSVYFPETATFYFGNYFGGGQPSIGTDKYPNWYDYLDKELLTIKLRKPDLADSEEIIRLATTYIPTILLQQARQHILSKLES